MKILDILENTNVAVVLDTYNGGDLGAKLQNQAVAAVTDGGIGSPAWIKYMSLFADNARQLERLTVPKDLEDPYFRIGRAYVTGNGTCGPETNGETGRGLLPRLEADLYSNPGDEEPDGSIVDPPGPDPNPGNIVVRPFVIPRIPKP